MTLRDRRRDQRDNQTDLPLVIFLIISLIIPNFTEIQKQNGCRIPHEILQQPLLSCPVGERS